MANSLSARRAEALVWQMLTTRPGQRPSAAEVAAAAGINVLTLRRALRQDGRSRLRTLITWGCVTFAADAIL